MSLTMPGYPFVTLLPYVLDAEARPLFLVSDLAEHTRNLKRNPCASLMVAEASRLPLEAPRVTLVGEALPIAMPAAAIDRFMRYFSGQPINKVAEEDKGNIGQIGEG